MTKFASDAEALQFLGSKAAAEGQIGKPAIEAFAAKIVATIPESSRGDYNANDMVAAAEYYETWVIATGKDLGGDKGKDGSGIKKEESNIDTGNIVNTPATIASPILSTEEEKELENLLESTLPQRQEVSNNSSVSRLFTKNPVPSTFLTGKTVVPTLTDAQIAAYEKALVQNDTNIANFKVVVDAIKNAKPLPVHINDKAALRVEGAEIKIIGLEGKSGPTSQIFSNADLYAWLNTYTMGVLGNSASEISVGVEVQKLTPRDANNKRVANGGVTPNAKGGIRYYGHTDAIAAGNFTIINEQHPTDKTKQQRVRVTNTFQVYTTRDSKSTDAKGQPYTKTVRVSGILSDYPNFVRKEEYVSVWPEKSRTTISANLTQAQREQKINLLRTSMRLASDGKLVGGPAFTSEFASKLKSARAAAANSTPPVTGE